MIFGTCFYVEPNGENIDRARTVLMRDFGLVPPRNDTHGRTEEHIIVWEDESGIGRYRVGFCNDSELKGTRYDEIQFRYFLNSRKNREVFKQDPMKDAIAAVKLSLEGKFFERCLLECSIEEVLNPEE